MNSGSSGTGDYASNYKTPNYTQYTQQDFKGNKSKLSIKSVNPIIFLFQLFSIAFHNPYSTKKGLKFMMAVRNKLQKLSFTKISSQEQVGKIQKFTRKTLK